MTFTRPEHETQHLKYTLCPPEVNAFAPKEVTVLPIFGQGCKYNNKSGCERPKLYNREQCELGDI